MPNPARVNMTAPTSGITERPVGVGGGVDSVGIVVGSMVGGVVWRGVWVRVDAMRENDEVATAFGTVTPVTVTR